MALAPHYDMVPGLAGHMKRVHVGRAIPVLAAVCALDTSPTAHNNSVQLRAVHAQ